MQMHAWRERSCWLALRPSPQVQPLRASASPAGAATQTTVPGQTASWPHVGGEAGERLCLFLPALCHRLPDFRPQSAVSLQVDEGSFGNLPWSSGLGEREEGLSGAFESLATGLRTQGTKPFDNGQPTKGKCVGQNTREVLGEPTRSQVGTHGLGKDKHQLQTLRVNAA